MADAEDLKSFAVTGVPVRARGDPLRNRRKAMGHSWYRHYVGNSMGRILHFLNVYCGLRIAESAAIGPKTITYQGQQIATYTMLDELEVEGLNGWKFKSKFVPVFEFHRADFALCQKKLQRAAILESVVHEAQHNVNELKKNAIRSQIEESTKILEEALVHEFDFYRISREDIGKSENDCDE